MRESLLAQKGLIAMGMMVDQTNTFLESSSWKKRFPGLTALFTTKHGGVSQGYFSSLNTGLHVNDQRLDVIHNRHTVARNSGWELNKWIFADQVHGTRVVQVTSRHAGMGTENYSGAVKAADGLWTFDQGVGLSLGFADCVPIYFAEPETGYAGVAHAGWKGSVGNIAGEMIRQAAEAGVCAEKVYVMIGPSIGECCYQVDQRVIDQIPEDISGKGIYETVAEGQYKLNLQELNKQLLLKAGVKEHHIEISGMCTGCYDQLFFSHRRDQGKTGRMSAVIGWRES
ncbi:peptidoglycan editing factor PgeF [Jeotgalibacillus haloalkalitolerans]|uniref:Purine nucleoside phosphorylase n=1 Tax=Jeotgalibacillus haloalkalitolerans TaxID=3104292 RepID=A0ABU5KJY5_9BACL|nr:peptidoglycan editing factor PgeF [Jeotgalibacillus sp. HH7-29]MDZ5711577.1 peptidoglycan editing factor PgeF [Jeotgalibacillus sp. HH7-29]